MGSLSFGRSKSKSDQQSSSLGLGYGYSGSDSSSLSSGTSQSTSGGQATSSQNLAFADLFQQLYGGASSVAQNLATKTAPLTDQAQQLFSGGVDFMKQLAGGTGEDYLTSRLTESPELKSQIENLGTDIGDFFRENVNPSITRAAIDTGTLGGGRQGVAQGIAAKAAAREFATGATNLRAADLASRDQAAEALMQGRTAAAATGLSALPSLLNAGTTAFSAELAPYQALAAIMGGPTVLGTSQSTQFGQSSSEQLAQAISDAFGENFSYDSSQSTASSRARSTDVRGSFLFS